MPLTVEVPFPAVTTVNVRLMAQNGITLVLSAPLRLSVCCVAGCPPRKVKVPVSVRDGFPLMVRLRVPTENVQSV